MGVREHVSRNQRPVAHVVQLFDSDDTRHEAVAAFLADGYVSGSPLVIVARPMSSAAILDRLEQQGVQRRSDAASGRLTVLDAADTLKRISRAGTPDARRFDDVVGALLTQVSRHGHTYAYGEMVDILAQRGDFADAARLEQLWNGALARTSVSLMCGYSAAHFVPPATHEALRAICAAHSDVLVEFQDPLAAWLLQQAQ